MSSTVVETIIASVDLVDYVSQTTSLKRVGNTYRGCCPLHEGNNESSFTIYNDRNYYCFACGKGGNIINFVSEQEGIGYIEAVEMLAQKANIDLGKDTEWQREKSIFEKNQSIADKHYRQLDVIRDYLHDERGLTDETIDNFYLGYDNNRKGKSIVIPLHDKNGRIVAFCKRYLDCLPKYVNSKNNELYEKGEFLFNAYRAKRQLKNFQRLYICEGYIDAMSAYQQGCACVAYCGSELTKGQINEIREMLLHVPNVVIMYAPDNDDVGQSKIQRTWEKFNELAPKLDVRVVCYPKDRKDFNEVLLAGESIPDLPSEPIALKAIKQSLDECFDKTSEFSVATEKIKMVKNPLIKAEIVEYLAKRWDKPVSDIKEITTIDFFDDEMIADFKDTDKCVADYFDLINTEGLGIGFPSIDSAMKLRPTDVVFWAGYSGTYKTMIACEVALHNAIRLKKNVLFFSLEMSAGSLYERLIARILKKSTKEVEEMAKDGQQAIILQKIKEKLQERLYVVDKSNLTIKDVEKYIILANTRIIKQGQVDYVILDYFQYLNMNTFEEMSAGAKYTKVIAKNHNVVFFILSQLNRTGDNFVKPTLKMLKGTGDMEASGDYVALAWTPAENPKLDLDEREKLQGHVCVAIGKARRGTYAREFELKYNQQEGRLMDLSVENG
ncbi:DnaB-like helicase C-terminal domain-containing protein [Phascolarctobacterium succinatutens]|uniref:DnaB-like helicase C-terminal domain-containing protein n=1 Tax=Phascolarctobacterium succinatutens TaxID=626940 RepID=UPI00307D29A8